MQPTVPITPEVLESLDTDFNMHSFVQVHQLQHRNGRLVVTPENSTETREFLMDPDAQKYLASFLGVPLDYASKIDDPALTELIWNYHIRHRGSDIDVLKLVAMGDNIKTFTVRSFNPLQPSAVVRACQEAIPDAVFERQPYVHGKNVSFYLTGPDLYENFSNTLGTLSDVHHFSVGCEFNFAGDGSPEMRSYGHRHSCGNLMESPYGAGGKQFRIFTTDPQQVLAKFTEYTRKGVEFIRQIQIPKIRGTMETQQPDMANEISDLAKKYGLNERVESLIFEALRTEDLGGTTYHMVNAITRAANSDRCPPNMIRRLHQIAGEITVRHDPAAPPRRCPECHQKVKPRLTAPVDETVSAPNPETDPEPHNH